MLTTTPRQAHAYTPQSTPGAPSATHTAQEHGIGLPYRLTAIFPCFMGVSARLSPYAARELHRARAAFILCQSRLCASQADAHPPRARAPRHRHARTRFVLSFDSAQARSRLVMSPPLRALALLALWYDSWPTLSVTTTTSCLHRPSADRAPAHLRTRAPAHARAHARPTHERARARVRARAQPLASFERSSHALPLAAHPPEHTPHALRQVWCSHSAQVRSSATAIMLAVAKLHALAPVYALSLPPKTLCSCSMHYTLRDVYAKCFAFGPLCTCFTLDYLLRDDRAPMRRHEHVT